jgi:hypothetical protein
MTRDYEKDWEEFWKGICTNPDGSINLDQIKRELSDFRHAIEEVPKVYCHITNNRLSKIVYDASQVIAVAEDCANEYIKELKNEILLEIDNEINYYEERTENPDNYYLQEGLYLAREIVDDNL